MIGAISEETIIDTIEDASAKTAFVVVDLEGTASMTVAYAISRADLLVIPVQGSQLDARRGGESHPADPSAGKTAALPDRSQQHAAQHQGTHGSNRLFLRHRRSASWVLGETFECAIGGVVELVTTFIAHNAPGFWWSLVSAVIGVVAGIILVCGPIIEDVLLTLLLVVFFNVEGLAWTMYALEHKRQRSGPWTWMLVSGIVDLMLAFVILCRLPGAATWALSLLVGTSMLFGGTSMIAMATHARKAAPERSVKALEGEARQENC